jgi:hypothetical protein
MFPDLKKENCALFIYIFFLYYNHLTWKEKKKKKKGMCVFACKDIERESDDGYKIEKGGHIISYKYHK